MHTLPETPIPQATSCSASVSRRARAIATNQAPIAAITGRLWPAGILLQAVIGTVVRRTVPRGAIRLRALYSVSRPFIVPRATCHAQITARTARRTFGTFGAGWVGPTLPRPRQLRRIRQHGPGHGYARPGL